MPVVVGPVDIGWSAWGRVALAGNSASYAWNAPGKYTVILSATSACRSLDVSIEVEVTGEAVMEYVYLPMVVR